MESGRYKGVVFVTDDDDEWRESVRELLEQQGFIVLDARSGGEALARMRGISGPAVAIIDLVMPGIDGWELIETIRADRDLKRIPIIVISAHAIEPVEGADRVLAKPVVPSELLRHVVELCR
jgi:adenylate cyclase